MNVSGTSNAPEPACANEAVPADGLSSATTWVVFDLETTGLSPACDDIIQIAAVRMRDGRHVEGEMFFSFADPGRPIPPWITHYTGVRPSDVQGAPSPEDVLRAFSRFVGNSTLVAHNGHRFDMRFLEACARRRGVSHRVISYHDSLALSWQLWGRRGMRHGMDAVIQRLGLGPVAWQRHDARGDVMLLARAIEMMCERLRSESGALPCLRGYTGLLPSDSLSDAIPSPSAG